MPGVNPPVNEWLVGYLANLHNRIAQLETQQQQTITNNLGQPLLNLGLIPGSNPPMYGLQFVNPNNGAQTMFLGEDGSGNAVFESGNYTPGSAGFQITPDGNASFNQLTLAQGIIFDSALAKPVNIGFCNAVQASITYTGGTFSTRVTGSITVPSGFSQANVMGIATAGTTWPAGGGDLSALCVINGNSGDTIGCGLTAQGALSVSAPFGISLTGVSGTISVACSAAGTNGTSGSGNARVSALALFLR